MNLLPLINYHPIDWELYAMIKKTGKGYEVRSKKGKKLSRSYKSMGQAKKRLKQIEYFKHKKG